MKTLLEKEAEDFLEKNNFNIVNRAYIKTKDSLKQLKIKFPWAMKIISEKAVHKSRINGVKLNIKNYDEAIKAYNDLIKIDDKGGILIQEMISGQELILGIKDTPDFGMVLMLGAGGTNVEKIKDITFRITPINQKDAEEMIDELKIKIINKKEVEKTLMQLSELTKKNKIVELDINPLIINEKAHIVDARIILS